MSQKLDRFHKYFVLYEKMVKRNAQTFLGSHLAEDVAQEVFWSMYQRIDYLKDDTVKRWLLVVTGNIARDYLKKGGSTTTYLMEPELLQEYMELTEGAVDDVFERREKQKAAAELCAAALEMLYRKNPDWYYAIVDSALLDMSSRQIADVLNTTVSHVDVMKCRARKYLQKRLGREYDKLL